MTTITENTVVGLILIGIGLSLLSLTLWAYADKKMRTTIVLKDKIINDQTALINKHIDTISNLEQTIQMHDAAWAEMETERQNADQRAHEIQQRYDELNAKYTKLTDRDAKGRFVKRETT